MRSLVSFFAASAYVAALILLGRWIGGWTGLAAALGVPAGALILLLVANAEIKTTGSDQ